MGDRFGSQAAAQRVAREWLLSGAKQTVPFCFLAALRARYWHFARELVLPRGWGLDGTRFSPLLNGDSIVIHLLLQAALLQTCIPRRLKQLRLGWGGCHATRSHLDTEACPFTY
jgi:hypothetical protein